MFSKNTSQPKPDIILSDGGFWPPIMGSRYPDITLTNYRGERVRLSQFAGKVLLIQTIGMRTAANNSFSGGHVWGGYEGSPVQQDLLALEDYLRQFASIPIRDPRLVYIHLILFDMDDHSPSWQDAAKWAKHFHLLDASNIHVLVANSQMSGKASYNLVPGVQLVDKQFILRSQSIGTASQTSLYSELLPLVRQLLGE